MGSALAALQFDRPSHLGWLLVALIPWLIHRFLRRRPTDIAWAAMEVLWHAVRRRAQRIRIESLVLLLLRTLVLLLAALAMLRPAWRTAPQPATSAAATHHLLLVDCSLSMGVAMDGSGRGPTRLQQVKRRLLPMLDRLASGDSVTVVAWQGRARATTAVATFDREAARRAIRVLEVSDERADLAHALQSAVSLVQRANQSLPSGTVHVVSLWSDATAATWQPLGEDPEDPPGASVRAAWSELEQWADVRIETVEHSQDTNWAITSIRCEPTLPTLDEAAQVVVEVRRFGPPTAAVNGEVRSAELLIDGATRHVPLPSEDKSGVATARFSWQPLSIGSHLLEARLKESADPIKIDDRRWHAVEVVRRLRVACLAADPAEAVDFARALNPNYDQPNLLAAGTQVEMLPVAQLETASPSTWDVLAVINIAVITQRELRLLEQYVERGGVLLVVLGDRVDAAQFNRQWQASQTALPESEPLLPVRVEPAVSGTWGVDPLDWRHRATQVFQTQSRSGWENVQVHRYFPLQAVSPSRAMEVVYGLDSGDPLVVIGRYGTGSVAVLASDPKLARGPVRTSPDSTDDPLAGRPWSNWALSPSFLPAMQELVAHLVAARRPEQLNRLVGERLTVPSRCLAGEPLAVRWQLPEGSVAGRSPMREAAATHQDTTTLVASRAGAYRATLVDSNETAGKRCYLTANVDPRESDLAPVDLDRLTTWTPAPTQASGQQGIAISRATLTRWFVGIAAAMALLELIAAWRIGSGWA
jgi:hypothetical protein